MTDPEDSNDDSSASNPEPSNVATRARRSNAGNFMRKLIAEEENEIQEFYGSGVWAEDEDDADFGGDGQEQAGDDVMSDSDSEDDDENADDDAGEKDLRKEERQAKIALKRKRRDPFAEAAAIQQKKQRKETDHMETTGAMAPPPRPKKKSERVSWLPEAHAGPVRASSRQLTVQNKQMVAQSLEEKEKHRLDILETMKRAEKRKEKDQPKRMTQAEKLAEAARVEKRNSKTLSRWEESERQKAEENKARLEALKNRKLDGPFIRYYSGPSIWVNDKLKHVGKDSCKIEDLVNEPEETQTPPKKREVPNHTSTTPQVEPTTGHLPADSGKPELAGQKVDEQNSNLQVGSAKEGTIEAQSINEAAKQSPKAAPPSTNDLSNSSFPQTLMPAGQGHNIMFAPPSSFLDGIFDWASMDPTSPERNRSSSHAHAQSQPPPSTPLPSAEGTTQQPHASSAPPFANSTSSDASALNLPFPESQPAPNQDSSTPFPPPPSRKVVLRAVRNLLTLHNHDNLRARDRDALARALFHWPPNTPIALPPRPPPGRGARNAHLPHRELCCITAQPAKYRDPLTGLPYADKFAFRSIRRFVAGMVGRGVEGRVRWSNLLGAFVGPRGEGGRVVAAKGVPERFWDGRKKESEGVGEEGKSKEGQGGGEAKESVEKGPAAEKPLDGSDPKTAASVPTAGDVKVEGAA
ncbi:YL1 nuclear protein-domain-containing protein [Phyllosticta citribraziliensis]|uniref:YL1 nuclear protein-domain-containing protein n=1 Tax=Phyllosticta citribraziliensis TaxID=989973 RepID=A0ABR1LU34_9PEZI